jgi:hypothetical protein
MGRIRHKIQQIGMKFAPKHPNATFSDKIFFRRMSMDVEICLSKLDVSDKAE